MRRFVGWAKRSVPTLSVDAASPDRVGTARESEDHDKGRVMRLFPPYGPARIGPYNRCTRSGSPTFSASLTVAAALNNVGRMSSTLVVTR
jgi:hypothetical protein